MDNSNIPDPSFNQPPSPKKNNTPVIVAVIIIITAAIVAGLIAYSVISKNRHNKGGKDETALKSSAVSPAKQTMPDLEGYTQENAIKELADLGFYASITEVETDEQKEGCVLSHVPKAGVNLKDGEEVTLYIAKPKPTSKPSSSSSGSASSKIEPKVVETVYLYCTADDFVSLRSGAGSGYTELARIPRGDAMLYQNAKEGSWYLVSYDNKSGYVYDAYVSYSPPPAVSSRYSPKAYDYLYCTADDFVSLRSGPGVDYTELVRIPSGDKMIYLYDKSGKWYYVQYGSQKGYVYEDYVTSPP